jgi:hypothetical protein
MLASMKPSEIVEGALEILEEKGWCQNADVNVRGQVCVGEALVQAATDNMFGSWDSRTNDINAYTTVHDAAKAVVYAAYSHAFDGAPIDPMSKIIVWNDKPSTAVEQVKDTMMTAAKNLRDQGE